MHIVHIQCLVEGSILAVVFLTSSCVVSESSYSSNTAISSLLISWSSNCSIALSQWWPHSKCQNVQLPHSVHVDYYWVHRKPLCRLHPHRAHMHVVLSHYSDSLTVSSYRLNWFDTTELRSMRYTSLHAKPHKTHVLCTRVL